MTIADVSRARAARGARAHQSRDGLPSISIMSERGKLSRE